MKFYLCAGTSQVNEMEAHRLDLETMDHEITSRWHQGLLGSPRLELIDPKIEQRAMDDLIGINEAETLIAFGGSKGRGGRHFEAGYAYGIGQNVWFVGDMMEHAFHTLAHRTFKSWDDCYMYISKEV